MQEFETFREFGNWEIGNMKSDKPGCFNGNVVVRKNKVTIELVDEPLEVIQARIKQMWDDCDNHHHRQPLRAAAKEYGLEL